MPELAEVEVVRRALLPHLLGRRVRSVYTSAPSYFFLSPPSQLQRHLKGAQIQGLSRHGKYLLMALDEGRMTLMLHLGMTGQLLYLKRLPRGWRTEPHLHLVLGLGDGFLLFRDPRKFGKCALLWGDEVHPRLARLGVDALVVRGRHLQASGRGRRVAIKTFLLEQAVVAGVGNIYADEALFRVGIAPDVPCSRLTPSQWDSLAGEIRAVLRQAIRRGGSTVSDYRRPDGSRGGAQASHRVYGRTGQPCLRCGSLIQRLVLGGRSAHFCARCQGRV